MILHRATPGLGLPALKAPAVVGHPQRQAP
jgi:hypothetical protein